MRHSGEIYSLLLALVAALALMAGPASAQQQKPNSNLGKPLVLPVRLEKV